MKFKLETSEHFYPDPKDRERLEKLGFSFELYDPKDGVFEPQWIMKDFDDDERIKEVEICSLEELLRFIDKHGEIVLNRERIEIYDGYREH